MKFEDLKIKSVTWNQRSIQIVWSAACAGSNDRISCLYQHSDGKWSVDPASRRLGSKFGENLLSELMKLFITQAFPYDDSSSFTNSEVARVEGILRKDVMYRKNLHKSHPVNHRRHPERITVWFDDSVFSQVK